MIVARPRAVPIPRPFMALGPTRLNLSHRIGGQPVFANRQQIDYVHRRILQHVGNNEEANHAPSNVDLIQLRNSSVSSCHSDLLQRDIQRVLGY